MSTKKRTESGQDSRTKGGQELPRGYRVRMMTDGRERPALLLVRGKVNESFATEGEAIAAGLALVEKETEFGREVRGFDVREWRRYLEAKRLYFGGLEPDWPALARGNQAPAKVVPTVAKAVSDYLAARRDGGNLSKDTQRHFKKHLEDRFAADFGALRLDEVTADTIRGWLKALRHPRTGKPMEPLTRRHHRKDLNTFLLHCVGEGWIQKNPCEIVALPTIPEQDVQLLTVEEVRRLFEKNAGKRVLGRLALEAFGFMRASSAGRAQREDILFESKALRMPGTLHKSRKTKHRQGHPDNLWAWLAAAPAETWAMNWWEYRNEKRIAFAVAELGDSENRLRKTCLSAHLAWQKNQPLTSYLAQHRNTSTTEIYLGVMDERDGAAYFEIRPSA